MCVRLTLADIVLSLPPGCVAVIFQLKRQKKELREVIDMKTLNYHEFDDKQRLS